MFSYLWNVQKTIVLGSVEKHWSDVYINCVFYFSKVFLA